MAKKILIPYSNLTAAEIVAKASPGICNLSVNGEIVEASNVPTAKVRNFFGESTNRIGALDKSNKINKWSGFSPYKWDIVNQVVVSSLKTPYDLSYLSGYNHNAMQPVIEMGTSVYNLSWTQAGQVWNKTITINLGEVNWYAELGYQFCSVWVDSSFKANFDLTAYKANSYQEVSFDITLPAQGGSKTWNIEVFFGSPQGAVGKLPNMTATLTVNVSVPAQFGGVTSSDTEADRLSQDWVVPYQDSDDYVSHVDVFMAGGAGLSYNACTISYRYYGQIEIRHSNGTLHSPRYIIPERVARARRVMWKENRGVESERIPLTTGAAWLEYDSSVGYGQETWNIPQALLPINDYDIYHVTFDQWADLTP